MRPIFQRAFRILRVGLLLLASGVAFSGFAQPASTDVREQNRRLGRGLNILGYDPIWRNLDQARFQEGFFKKIKGAGFDSVRINLHAFRHMDAAKDFAIQDSWWTTLDWAVRGATSQGLATILDLHEFSALGEDPEGNKARFLAFWRQVAPRYRNSGPGVFFEILNEPNKKLTPTLWNGYLAEALAIIRESNPTRTVIVGPGFWNGIGHLQELRLPESDRHLIVTVHYYLPMEFTHQGASWTDHKTKSGIVWEGTEAERRKVAEDLGKAAAWGRSNDRPIFLGEFGAYDRAPMESRVRYTDAVARTAEGLGFSWAYWQFDSDFIVFDIPKGDWVEPIRRALIPGH